MVGQEFYSLSLFLFSSLVHTKGSNSNSNYTHYGYCWVVLLTPELLLDVIHSARLIRPKITLQPTSSKSQPRITSMSDGFPTFSFRVYRSCIAMNGIATETWRTSWSMASSSLLLLHSNNFCSMDVSDETFSHWPPSGYNLFDHASSFQTVMLALILWLVWIW